VDDRLLDCTASSARERMKDDAPIDRPEKFDAARDLNREENLSS
jgi:hypothetical protein